MKKLLFAGAILFGSVGMYACGGNEGTTETEQNETGTMENDATGTMNNDATGTMETDTTMMNTDTAGTGSGAGTIEQ